ncbi:hypothetical protein GCM10010293_65540 [Streptomyces griseoflavus]|nr:hypothetical protein GCM10010293_65540 [Streptomyces griseoflavus]
MLCAVAPLVPAGCGQGAGQAEDARASATGGPGERYGRAGGAEGPEGSGTPTAFADGKRLPLDYSGVPYDSALFADSCGRWSATRTCGRPPPLDRAAHRCGPGTGTDARPSPVARPG